MVVQWEEWEDLASSPQTGQQIPRVPDVHVALKVHEQSHPTLKAALPFTPEVTEPVSNPTGLEMLGFF